MHETLHVVHTTPPPALCFPDFETHELFQELQYSSTALDITPPVLCFPQVLRGLGYLRLRHPVLRAFGQAPSQVPCFAFLFPNPVSLKFRPNAAWFGFNRCEADRTIFFLPDFPPLSVHVVLPQEPVSRILYKHICILMANFKRGVSRKSCHT